MSEYAIPITNLNDLIFCPASIYFHSLDMETERMTYQLEDQLNGAAAHTAVDTAAYSSSRSVLQGVSIYSEQFDLFGKIGTFDESKGLLRARKKRIKKVNRNMDIAYNFRYMRLKIVKRSCIISSRI